jgi:shikimate kinase
MTPSSQRNLVLIGMPGAGKSTVGVLLAKATSREFMDTDVLIQAREGRLLQHIVDSDGMKAFCRIEEQYLLDIQVRSFVIATGGSVIYSEAAMEHLQKNGLLIYLNLPLKELCLRLDNLATRGVVIPPGQSMTALYQQRTLLYQRWADLTINATGKNQDQVVTEILERINE